MKKVAIVHDWLTVNGGAEKVLTHFLELFPQADLFTLVDFLPEKNRSWLKDRKIKTSFIQNLPFAKTKYSSYLALFPIAIEQFDLSGYDLIISSSYCAAKGVITGPNQLHISYCHSPARYAWDLQPQYLKESKLERGVKSILARYILHKFRIWDVRSSNGVDGFIANSGYIKKRINKCYRRDSVVIYPPVDLTKFSINEEKKDYYVTASRFVPYKRIDIIVEAFRNMPNKKLIVIGSGPEDEKIKAQAKGSENIELLGFTSNEALVQHMREAKAFVFAAEEDFGIVPVEAQACGTPVIAYAKGGSLETVVDGKTGIYFYQQTAESLRSAVEKFEALDFDPKIVRSNAEKFSIEIFKTHIKMYIDEMMLNNK